MKLAEGRDGSISPLSCATSLVAHALLGVSLFVAFRYPTLLPEQRLIEVTIVASAASPLPPEQVITQDAPQQPIDVPEPLEQQPVKYRNPLPIERQSIDQPIVDAPQVSNVTSQEGALVKMYMESISDAVPTYNPPPHYPEFARKQGYEGVVMLQVKISPWGHPDEVLVVGSSGYEMLDLAAANGVRDWRFEPARNNQGDFVSTTLRLPIVFKLD
ncbi:MAG: energy transducer TonB [Alphaproteobacteria bacterium]|nr:energy transducer TonB [Alphaproteobacteria bacterium]